MEKVLEKKIPMEKKTFNTARNKKNIYNFLNLKF